MGLLASTTIAADDGRRAVDVPQFGVSVRAPLAWTLIQWAQDDRAFVLRLPQEHGSPPGSVSCQLELSAGTLGQWREQQLALDSEPKQPKLVSKIVSDAIEPLDAERFESLAGQDIHERWVRLCESSSAQGRKTFELACHMLHGGIVYGFTLRTDEEHYDAYRADFEDLCAAARFGEPTRGPVQLAGGFWLQRDFGFALWLPAGFQPAFAARGKILLSAARRADEKSGSAELLVVASAGPPWDLDALRAKLPDEIAAADAKARVDRCQIVPQGQSRALETVVYSRRGGQPVVTFARRFRGHERNYELRATCPGDELETHLEGCAGPPTVFARSSRRNRAVCCDRSLIEPQAAAIG